MLLRTLKKKPSPQWSWTLIANSSVAEQVAIALELTDGVHDTIYSDSKSAIKAFQMGMVAAQLLQIIHKVKELKNHSLVWFFLRILEPLRVPRSIPTTRRTRLHEV
ncbi:hypothetical protein HPB52_013266 [Rhipicephalus sanguineus]|uniref:Tick transposon n=1 Tax=Rhipicephalus sanguineus TaxID=34632 RepID=A0A9D4Q9R6_RHISA|nr:hypothetical protein HPB52_013266 [Rhipicephalus sanguineus]